MNAITQITAEPFSDLSEWSRWFTGNIDRHNKARAAAMAIHDCDPEDRIALLEFLVDYFSPGTPIPAFGSVMAEASQWANWANRNEIKAYLVACFNRLNRDDQAAFRDFIDGKAAA